jgi:hypothetical protein
MSPVTNSPPLATGALLVAALLLSCSNPEQSPEPPIGPDFAYTVNLPSMGLDSVHVSLVVNRWNAGDSVRLVAPFLFADNPTIPQTDVNFRNARLTDSGGTPIAVRSDSVLVGLAQSLRLSFPAADLPAHLEYDVSFHYGPSWMPLPFVGATAGYLQGPYLYAVPFVSESLAVAWRSPADIAVEYRPGPGVDLRGDPLPRAHFGNVYELLFSTSALGGTLLTQGSGRGQAFRFVNLQDTSYAASLVDSIRANFSTILDDVCGLFGTLGGTPFTVIMGVNKGGGLEGMYAFSLLNPVALDTHGYFNIVLAHEAMHSWVGIRTGDYDDPWWKEGTAEYLGLLVCARHNLCSRQALEAVLLADLRDSADVRDYALSNPVVRNRLYAPVGGMGNLVYVKGAQVCMLMDRRIREASSGATSLDKVVGAFTAAYRNRGFHRDEYLSFIASRSGADLEELFATCVDQPGGLSDSLLRADYAALNALGAYGPPVVLAKSRSAPLTRPFVGKW